MSFCVKLSPTPDVFYSVTEGVQYDAGARASGPYLSGSTQIMRPNAHPGDAARGTHQQRLRLPWKVKSSGRLWSAEAVHCEPQTNTRHCITAAAATYHLAASSRGGTSQPPPSGDPLSSPSVPGDPASLRFPFYFARFVAGLITVNAVAVEAPYGVVLLASRGSRACPPRGWDFGSGAIGFRRACQGFGGPRARVRLSAPDRTNCRCFFFAHFELRLTV
jgi:hypothetical protein